MSIDRGYGPNCWAIVTGRPVPPSGPSGPRGPRHASGARPVRKTGYGAWVRSVDGQSAGSGRAVAGGAQAPKPAARTGAGAAPESPEPGPQATGVGASSGRPTGTAGAGTGSAGAGSSGCFGVGFAIVGVLLVVGLIIEFFAWFVGAMVVLSVLALIGYVVDRRDRRSTAQPPSVGRDMWSARTPPSSTAPRPTPAVSDTSSVSQQAGTSDSEALADGLVIGHFLTRGHYLDRLDELHDELDTQDAEQRRQRDELATAGADDPSPDAALPLGSDATSMAAEVAGADEVEDLDWGIDDDLDE